MDSPSGTTRCTSACVPARVVRHCGHAPQPSSAHCSAAANARAATDRPDPGGPVNSHACVIPAAPAPDTTAAAAPAAARSTATASG